jgi:hypothetical protein
VRLAKIEQLWQIELKKHFEGSRFNRLSTFALSNPIDQAANANYSLGTRIPSPCSALIISPSDAFFPPTSAKSAFVTSSSQ